MAGPLHLRGGQRAAGWRPLWLGAWLVAVGCATPTWQPDRPLTGDLLIDGPYAITHAPARDRVLWQYRTGLAALERGRPELARDLFDAALARLANIYGPDKDARQARRLFAQERKKTFLGEPYERTMAWYYRGILYWMDGEPDNARACFRSAQFMDSDAWDQQYVGDYVLPDYLDGWITERLGGDGAEALERARKNARLAIPPPPPPQANTVFFLQYGNGPRKYGDGEYGEQLKFRPGASRAREAKVRVEDQAAHVGPYDDLYFQATTRGGREMDHVLAGQAVFKSSTDSLGDAALISGAVLASQRDTRDVGAIVMAAGLLSKIISSAAMPQADTRTWDNLPAYLSLAAFKLPPGRHTATIEFLDEQRQTLNDLTKTVHFTVPENGTARVLFVSDRTPTPMEIQ